MSNYNIHEISSWTPDNSHSNAGITSQTLTQFEITSQDFFLSGEDDIVKVGVSLNGVVRYVYGVQVDQIPQQVGSLIVVDFDGNVYGDLMTGGTFHSTQYYTPTSANISLALNSYNLSPNLQVATYGKDFKAYNSTLSYTIQAPQQRLVYNTRFKSLYNLNEKILIDSCNNNVYKVAPSELSAVAVNGRIKSALNFNVFIK